MVKRISKHLDITLFFILVFIQSNAQQTRSISLQDAISTAINNNAQVRISLTDEKIASARLKQTNAIFLPQASLSYAAYITNNPLNSFGFKLQQQSITPEDFDPQKLNNPSAISDLSTRIEIQQPLINIDHWYNRKAAARQVEMYRNATLRTKDHIEFEIHKTYRELQLIESAIKVLEESLSSMKALYQYTNDRFEQGLVQRSDLLNIQVQLVSVESELSKARNNALNVSDLLGLLMGMGTGIIYQTIEGELPMEYPLVDSLPFNRPDFKAMKNAIEAAELNIQSTRKSYLPKLNAFANWQTNDNSLFGFESNAYFAGIQLSWEIFKGFKTKNVIRQQQEEKNRLEQELSAQQSQGQMELNNAKRMLLEARSTIKKQELAVEQAEESFRILNNRYMQGLVNTTDVLMSQTQLSQQKLQLANARFNEQSTIARLIFLTSTHD